MDCPLNALLGKVEAFHSMLWSMFVTDREKQEFIFSYKFVICSMCLFCFRA